MIDRLRTHVRALLGERHPLSSPAALQQAANYFAGQFQALDLDVTFHTFEALGGTHRNIIVTLAPATSLAAEPLVLAAHYDTVPGSPGADDNASGLAVLLEVAHRLREVRLHVPVRFIAFCLEEEDLTGSLAYASLLKERGEGIHGAIVLECVGFTSSHEGSQLAPPGVPIPVPSVGDFLAIVGNTDSAKLVSAVERNANQRVPTLKTVSLVVPGQGEGLPDTRRSDHAAFWRFGYPAVMLTDTANFRNPHYHRPTDTFDTLDFDFMEQVAEALIAATSFLAGRPPA